jgi:hypothetical protein
MEAKYYATCLWPGLADLWWRGRLSALPTAIAFAIALNSVLISRYLYPDWIHRGLVSIAFWLGVVAWLFYVIRTARDLPGVINPRSVSETPDQFPQARDAYLAGRWEDAEGLLTDVLAIEPRDPPALLLLTGVYRHTHRLEAAEILLTEIARLEVSDTWFLEVEAEAKRLKRAIDATKKRGKSNSVRPDPIVKDAADLTADNRKTT